eukprot:2826927-Rhodomonas_salina.1
MILSSPAMLLCSRRSPLGCYPVLLQRARLGSYAYQRAYIIRVCAREAGTDRGVWRYQFEKQLEEVLREGGYQPATALRAPYAVSATALCYCPVLLSYAIVL